MNHKSFRFPLLTLAAFALLLVAPATAQTLQLADGTVLLATLDGAPDGDGLRVRRLDNGGMLDLRWEHLSPECRTRIKQQFDLESTDQGELTVRVYEVPYMLNGSPRTVVGKIVDRTATHLVVQNKGIQYSIPKAELGTPRPVEVPVSQVYTKDEFYAARLAELQPGDSADKHVLFADELIRVRDYEHAKEHLLRAKELKNTRDPARLEGMLARLEIYRVAAKEKELLDQIVQARSRATVADFDKGQKLIARFETEFPQSKLKAEFDAEVKRFQEARIRFLTLQVADQFRAAVRYAAERKVVDGLTWAGAREYAEGNMTDDIVARVAGQLKLAPQEVKDLWQRRGRYPAGKRTESFAYGIGSWTLGEQAILKDTKQGKAQPKETKDPQQEREVERVARAIRQAMERRRAAMQGQQGDKEQSEEDWWKEASRAEQISWLRAYYAEFGGQLTVQAAYTQACISCYAAGSVTEPGPDGKLVRSKCYLCHGTKYLRTFVAW